MYDLESIVAQNRRAEELGIIKAGSAVGTTGYVAPTDRERQTTTFGRAFQSNGHKSEGGGIQPHSLGENYPFSVVGGCRPEGDVLVTTWTVVNYESGETFETYDGLPLDGKGCENAHNRAATLKRLSLSTTEE